LIVAMKKIFGISFTSSKDQTSESSGAQSPASASQVSGSTGKMPIVNIKQHMGKCLHDVNGIESERLLYSIRNALNVSDLWLLRSGLYQTIARQHSQGEAALRINALLPYFKLWIPERQLSSV
jgi:hypothetical protein